MTHKTTRMAKVCVAVLSEAAASSTAITHKQATTRWIGEAERIPDHHTPKTDRRTRAFRLIEILHFEASSQCCRRWTDEVRSPSELPRSQNESDQQDLAGAVSIGSFKVGSEP
jgi:hypothetical protein